MMANINRVGKGALTNQCTIYFHANGNTKVLIKHISLDIITPDGLCL